ncbi:MAG: SpoIIE family protein phosphatase [Candidatus Competibacteraceae bacterium]|nr:SpoIIE family protein phosphatase [Candidatus Competibacteraceae bacterium]
MKLRTRITLMVCGCFAIVAIVLILEGQFREWNTENRYHKALITGYRSAWLGITNVELQRMQVHISPISRNNDAISALAKRDPILYADSLRNNLLSLQDSLVPPQLETVTVPQDELFFTTVSDNLNETWQVENPLIQAKLLAAARQALPPNALSPELVAAAVNTLTPIVGMIRLQDDSFGLAVIFAILARTGPSGVAALYIDLETALSQFADSIGDEVFIVRPDGSLAQGADPDLWQALQAEEPIVQANETTIVHSLGKVFRLARLPLQDPFENTVASLFVARDITINHWRRLLVGALSYGLVAMVLSLFLAGLYWYLRYSFRPLNAVIRVLNALSRGNTQVAVADADRNDEIGRLAGTVERFRQAQEARQQLAVIQQEMDTATRIQRSIRPAQFPQRPDLSVFAELLTARAVGGDFFDYFDLPNGRFGFVVADVSDKGMGAALFMAVARTVIRATAQIVPEPGECMARANDFLSQDNDANMFVTTFYGVLDPANGKIVYANGGHLPPYRMTADGGLEALEGTGGIALGVMDGMPFKQNTVTLEAGDRLLLYTDGVTEGIDMNQQEYGVARLEETLRASAEQDVMQLTQSVIAGVIEFAGQEPQFDDITVMALAYHGPGSGSAVS